MRRALCALALVAWACGENEHRERADFVLLPTTALQHTSEAGGTTSFYVSLSPRPDHDIEVALRSSDPREATVTPSVVITPDNRPQLITVTGVDDPYVEASATPRSA